MSLYNRYVNIIIIYIYIYIKYINNITAYTNFDFIITLFHIYNLLMDI